MSTKNTLASNLFPHIVINIQVLKLAQVENNTSVIFSYKEKNHCVISGKCFPT